MPYLWRCLSLSLKCLYPVSFFLPFHSVYLQLQSISVSFLHQLQTFPYISQVISNIIFFETVVNCRSTDDMPSNKMHLFSYRSQTFFLSFFPHLSLKELLRSSFTQLLSVLYRFTFAVGWCNPFYPNIMIQVSERKTSLLMDECVLLAYRSKSADRLVSRVIVNRFSESNSLEYSHDLPFFASSFLRSGTRHFSTISRVHPLYEPITLLVWLRNLSMSSHLSRLFW